MKFRIYESEETNKFDNEDAFFATLRDGFHAELEHKETVGGDFIKVLEIALTHLKESPEYYTKLKKMESGDKTEETKDNEDEAEKDEDESDEKEDEEEEDEEEEDEEEDESEDKDKKNSLKV